MEQTKPKNNLPESWCVKNDGSQLFKDTVIKYIKKTYNMGLMGNNLGYYYGCSFEKRAYVDSNEHTFETQFTLQEFINLTTEWEPKYGERVIIGAVDGIEIEAIFLAKCKKDIFAKV